MRVTLSRKSTITATVACVIIFSLAAWLWPTDYTYETSFDCLPPGAHGVYNCPMEAVDTNGLTYSPINATAPLALIYIGSKSVTRIDYRSILTRATISAVVSWLIVYVLNDRRSKLRAVNRSAKLKVK